EFPLALVENAPCQEVVHRGNVYYADLFPTPMLCEGDAAHFINPGGLVQRDPDSGVLNVGCHRHQVDVSRYGRGRIGARTGEYTDLVHGHGAWPFLEITAITHRCAPYCHVLLSGRSEEHRVLSIITGWGMEEGLVARARRHFPNVVDAAFFPGSHISHAVVSFKKRYEDGARQ